MSTTPRTDDLLEVTCPRCKTAVLQRLYGPCDACRAELVASQQRAPKQVEVEAYEPKVNVVPNQVAMKAE